MKNKILFFGILLSFGYGFAQNTFPTAAGTNVGIGTTSPSTRLQITSATAGTSGVRLTNMTSATATTAGNSRALSVDASGNVILTPVVNAVISGTTIYSGDGTLSANRTVTMNGKNLTFNPTTANSQFFVNGITGNVGIGTLLPSGKLDVSGSILGKSIFGANTTASGTNDSDVDYFKKSTVFGAGFPQTFNGFGIPVIRHGFNVYDFYKSPLQHDTDETFVNIVERGGAEKFTFSAQRAQGTNPGVTALGMKDGNGNELLKISDELPGVFFMHLPKVSSRIVIGNFGGYLPEHKFVVANGSALIDGNILTNSNIGIGTSNFIDGSDTFRLAVNGAIRAHRVKVYTSWADFVFEKNYNLPTLEEVEKHIIEKGHLKDIPSASEVDKNGIELGEMNKKLLQKVEELTLYMIQLNKELQAVKSELKNN